MPMSSIEFVVHLAFVIHITCYIALTLQILGKKLVTISRVIGIITREFYTNNFGFEVWGKNIKVFYKQG